METLSLLHLVLKFKDIWECTMLKTFTLYFHTGKSLSEVHPWLDGAEQGTETESQESGAGQEISWNVRPLPPPVSCLAPHNSLQRNTTIFTRFIKVSSSWNDDLWEVFLYVDTSNPCIHFLNLSTLLNKTYSDKL